MSKEPELSIGDIILPNFEQMVKDELDKFFKAQIELLEAEERHAALTCTFTNGID